MRTSVSAYVHTTALLAPCALPPSGGRYLSDQFSLSNLKLALAVTVTIIDQVGWNEIWGSSLHVNSSLSIFPWPGLGLRSRPRRPQGPGLRRRSPPAGSVAVG